MSLRLMALRLTSSRPRRGPGAAAIGMSRPGPDPAGRSRREAGMTTAEYAVGTLAACAFAVILLAVVRSPAVRDALAKVITTALGMAG